MVGWNNIKQKKQRKKCDEFVEETKVDYIIYIRADADVCFHRVKKRARKGEEVIPEQYLKRCGEYHDNWLSKEKNIFTLDVNQDFTNNDMLEKWTSSIIDVLYEKTPTYYFTSKTLNNNKAVWNSPSWFKFKNI